MKRQQSNMYYDAFSANASDLNNKFQIKDFYNQEKEK